MSTERRTRPIGWGLIVLLTPLYGAAAIIFAVVIRIGGAEAYESQGPSMEPTLLNEDRFVVDKTAIGIFPPFAQHAVVVWGEPEPGVVVVIKSPQDDIDVIKRVVGVPGDVVEIVDDELRINGEAIPRTPLGACSSLAPGLETSVTDCFREQIGTHSFVTSQESTSLPSNREPTVVPEGHVYVLGDHRDRSNDSRYFGPVPIRCIRGEALGIYWSNEPSRVFTGVQ